MGDPFIRAKLDWLDELAADRRVSNLAFRVGYVIASKYLNRRTHDAWPAIQTLAADVSVSERAIQKALRELENLDYLRIVKGGGRGRTNRYELNRPKGEAYDTLSARKDERTDILSDRERVNKSLRKGEQAGPERVHKLADKGCTPVRPNPLMNPVREPTDHPPERLSATDSHQFLAEPKPSEHSADTASRSYGPAGQVIATSGEGRKRESRGAGH